MKNRSLKKMKTPNNLRLLQHLFVLLFTACSFYTYAQLELVPLPRAQAAPSLKTNNSSRTQAAAPRKLPFWDDFSFANKSFIQDSLWLKGKSVWISNGMAINPPSLGVATFDGLDSLGKPYNVNDVLAKGFADDLTSQPLRMDLIDPSLRSNVVITFFYQFQGNGEAPDPGDSIFLQFKNNTAQWETVWSRNNDGTLDKSVFTEVNLPITADRFYHEGFQFRFRNYARLSGPYDTWSLDYIYVSNGNTSSDPTNPSPFPDRTITSPLTSLFLNYTAIPIKHFLTSPSTLLTKPVFIIDNRRRDQTTLGQPVNYVSDAIITTRKGSVISKNTINLNNNDEEGKASVRYNTRLPITLTAIPGPDQFASDADSISVKIKVVLSTDDNLVKVTLPEPKGDYVPSIYGPVDFRVNDSTSNIFTLSNYYAYDDGSAEYGASLKGAGAQLMYKFEMKTDQPDALVGVYLYFPRFGIETSQIIQLQVFQDLLGSGSSSLYTESMTIVLSQQDKFIYHPFERPVNVQGSFYVGWKQSTSSNVVIGIDKNTDSGNNIYFNTNGSWEQNILTKGSLMIRPVVGEGGEIVGLPQENYPSAYPNPNDGTFFLSADASNIQIVDVTGKEVSFTSERNTENTQIKLSSAVTGIYIVRFALNDTIVTQKIIVKQ